MPRLSRRFTAALLWIAIALLPVRGFAAVLMPMMMMGDMPVPTASAPADGAAVTMPCHDAAQDVSDDSVGGGTHTCSLCDLCHSSVAAASAPIVALPALQEAQPLEALPPTVEPRAPDGLFRPPRTTLA